MNSANSVGYGRQHKLTSYAQKQCNKTNRDIVAGKALMRKIPKRIFPVMYDCVAENPHILTKILYQYTGLRFGNKAKHWISAFTHMARAPNVSALNPWKLKQQAAAARSSHFTMSVPNAFLAANYWRLNMKFEFVKKVDEVCQNLIHHLGLRPMPNEAYSQNIKLPSRHPCNYSYVSDFCCT